MGRPVKCRKICCLPAVCVFKPQCASLHELEEIELGLDEMEAMRLVDLEGLYHVDAAACMGVSRQTFGKIIAQARLKVASALIAGKALRIGPVNILRHRMGECERFGGKRKVETKEKGVLER